VPESYAIGPLRTLEPRSATSLVTFDARHHERIFPYHPSGWPLPKKPTGKLCTGPLGGLPICRREFGSPDVD